MTICWTGKLLCNSGSCQAQHLVVIVEYCYCYCQGQKDVCLLSVVGYSFLNQQALKFCDVAHWEAICGFVNLLISCRGWGNATRHGKSTQLEKICQWQIAHLKKIWAHFVNLLIHVCLQSNALRTSILENLHQRFFVWIRYKHFDMLTCWLVAVTFSNAWKRSDNIQKFIFTGHRNNNGNNVRQWWYIVSSML